MNFSPSNFYISIIDLFAILLPGVIASLVIYYFSSDVIDGLLNGNADNKTFFSGFVLLFGSYLFGHIISQVSAYLDKWVYDRFKEIVFKDHKCVDKVNEIRTNHYGNDSNQVYVNTYKWSVFKLQKEYPDAAAEVERYMADSKFFRSLFVIMVVLGFVFVFQPDVTLNVTIGCFILAAFSMIRYFKKRRKSTETAYQYIIFTEQLNSKIENKPKETVLAHDSMDKGQTYISTNIK
jgi:ABC-type multidrug transport system fused ATPase/permease subunit